MFLPRPTNNMIIENKAGEATFEGKKVKFAADMESFTIEYPTSKKLKFEYDERGKLISETSQDGKKHTY